MPKIDMVWTPLHQPSTRSAVTGQSRSEASCGILVVCLCICSLLIVSFAHAVSASSFEISSAESAESDPLDQAELDEEFLIASAAAAILVDRFLSRCASLSLHPRTLSLSPASPPPKLF